jgi:hypothetical protein
MVQDLKDDEPDWPEIQNSAKELLLLLGALAKNDPPKGSKDSWSKLTRAYVETGKAVQAAVNKKDKRKALARLTDMQQSCLGCHKNHRGY